MQQKVYSHNKNLFTRHLLSDKYSALGTLDCGRASRDSFCQSKLIKVFSVKLPKIWKYIYIVMCKTPPDCVPVHCVPEEEAKLLALGSGRAEMGIGSFMDNAKSQRFEQKAFKKKFPVKLGEVGRPRKSKKSKLKASWGKTDELLQEEKLLQEEEMLQEEELLQEEEILQKEELLQEEEMIDMASDLTGEGSSGEDEDDDEDINIQ